MMRNQRLYKILTATSCFLLMLIDAHSTRIFTGWSQGDYIWSVHFLLLLMLFSAASMPKNFMVILSLVLGSIFDLYYIGVLGIYAVTLPLVVWMMYLFYDTLYRNFFTYFFGMIILITGFEIVTLGIQYFFQLTGVQFVFFITRFLAPTLFINIVLFFILYYPLKKLFPRE